MKKHSSLVIFSLVLGLGLLLSGCGGTSPGPVTAAVPGASVTPGVGTYASGTCYGTVVSSGGSTICHTRYPLTLTPAGYNMAPFLAPTDDVSGPYAWAAVGAPAIKANDRLHWVANTSASGLGTPDINSKTYLGFITITTGSGSCKATPLDSAAGGLYATDGTQIFMLGSSLDRTMTVDATTLKVGFDDTGLSGAYCWNLTFSSFYLDHCENTAGTTVVCP